MNPFDPDTIGREIRASREETMPTSPSRRRRTLVENALLAELTRRLGGYVRVSEREVVALPRGLVAEMFVEEVPEKAYVLRLSGADYAVPSPAPPVVDEEKALFPQSFVTCPECKFSFERVQGDECPVCKLQEVESPPEARGEIGRLHGRIEALTRDYENAVEASDRANTDARTLRTALNTIGRQYDAERNRHASTREALDSARAALASKLKEVEAIRAELQLVASGRKTISAKPPSLSEDRPRETFDLIAKGLGGVVESYDTAGVYPGGGSELRTRHTVSFVLPVRFSSPFNFAEIEKMREENAMLKSVVANLPGGSPL
jgi:uncharacterized Zn finger protein (UPF0148 family)